MKLLNIGLIDLHKQLSELKQGWDGYDGKPIDKLVLESVNNLGFVSDIIKMFEKIGFAEKDIDVVPTSRGTIQYEAQRNNVYLEIEVDNIYYEKWKIQGETFSITNKGRPTIINNELKNWIIEKSKKDISSRKIAEKLKSMGIKIHFNTILNVIKGDDK